MNDTSQHFRTSDPSNNYDQDGSVFFRVQKGVIITVIISAILETGGTYCRTQTFHSQHAAHPSVHLSL